MKHYIYYNFDYTRNNNSQRGPNILENAKGLTENRIAILRFIADNPYISKSDLSKFVGISIAAISSNIEIMHGKYLRRVGPDKGGFWEILI